MSENIEGFIPCTYEPGFLGNERLVRFNAVGGSGLDGDAPHYDSKTRKGILISPVSYLTRSNGTSEDRIGSLQRGNGLLRVIKTDEYKETSIISVRCALKGARYDFLIHSKNFTVQE